MRLTRTGLWCVAGVLVAAGVCVAVWNRDYDEVWLHRVTAHDGALPQTEFVARRTVDGADLPDLFCSHCAGRFNVGRRPDEAGYVVIRSRVTGWREWADRLLGRRRAGVSQVGFMATGRRMEQGDVAWELYRRVGR